MRFAAHHVPPPPRRRFWLGVVLVLLLLAGPLALFNLAVDPFDFRLAPHLTLIRDMRAGNSAASPCDLSGTSKRDRKEVVGG